MKHSSVFALMCALSACGSSKDAAHGGRSSPQHLQLDAATQAPEEPHAPLAAEPAKATTESQPRRFLQWKRGAAFEADLSRALDLAPDSVCREFGTASCIREVHLVPLGGSNPFTTGMFEPAAEPLASTPTVVDRVILNACAQRAELDRSAGMSDAKVFRQFPLDGDAPDPKHDESRALVGELFQRLLARDPSDAEIETVAALARDDVGKPIAAADFAKLACFSIGSSAEFLFF